MFLVSNQMLFLSVSRCIPLPAPWTQVWAPWAPWAPSTATSAWTQPPPPLQAWTWPTPAPASATPRWPPWEPGPATCPSPRWPRPSAPALWLSWAPVVPAPWAPCPTTRTWASPWTSWDTPRPGPWAGPGPRRFPQSPTGVPWPTLSRHTRTSPSSPWRSSRAAARCSPWTRSTSGSWTCFHTTERTSSAGRTPSATRSPSTTASWRWLARQTSRAKVPTGLCTHSQATCSRTAATWGARSVSRSRTSWQRKEARARRGAQGKEATAEITWGRITAPQEDQMERTPLTQTTPTRAPQMTSRTPEAPCFH